MPGAIRLHMTPVLYLALLALAMAAATVLAVRYGGIAPGAHHAIPGAAAAKVKPAAVFGW